MKLKAIAILTAVALVAACSGKDDTLDASANADAAATTPGATLGSGSGITNAGLPPQDSVDYFNQVVGDRVFFDTDRYELDSEARTTLAQQAEWLAAYPGTTATIEGHADERGTREYNLALGARRAASVRDFLVSQGVAANRLETVSYGKERPVALGSDPESWAQNRRAVTVVLNAPLG